MKKARLGRSFIVVLLAALFAIPAIAKPKIETKEIAYDVGGVKLTGYLAWDANVKGKRPGILVVHEWWGLNDYAKMRARMLAELGYTAFALDMYGDGKVTDHPADAQKFASEVMKHMDVGVERFNAARKILEKDPHTDPTRIAAIGYCFGGSIVLHMARIGEDLKGVAAFHPGLGPISKEKPGAIKAKLLVCNGAADKMAPPELVAAFKKEMADARADMTFIDYPGAMHAFTNPDATALGKKYSIPIAYNEKADHESWKALQKFLKTIFEK